MGTGIRTTIRFPNVEAAHATADALAASSPIEPDAIDPGWKVTTVEEDGCALHLTLEWRGI